MNVNLTMSVDVKQLAVVAKALAGIGEVTATAVPMQSQDVPKEDQTVPAPKPEPKPTANQTVAPKPIAEQPVAPQTSSSYTFDDIARACTEFMSSKSGDEGAKVQAELQNLLVKYGTNALPSLAKEHYQAFITDIRQMGVDI